MSADVNMARKYSIPLQELPLVGRRLLETVGEDRLQPAITLTEAHMVAIQAAARKVPEKKAPRRPSPLAGQAWRTTCPAPITWKQTTGPLQNTSAPSTRSGSLLERNKPLRPPSMDLKTRRS